jgi:hypothetical protein
MRSKLPEAAALMLLTLFIGTIGWTAIVKVLGLGNPTIHEASATTSRTSDYERAGRVYPTFK